MKRKWEATRRGATAALGLVVVLAAAGTLLAAADTWKAAADGTFSVGTNWTDGTAPGAADSATFNVAGTYTVTFTTSPTNQDLFLQQGTVTFAPSGGTKTYSLTGGGGQDANITGGLLYLGGLTGAVNLTTGDDLDVRTGGDLTIRYASDVSVGGVVFVGAVASALGSTVTVSDSGSSLTGSTFYIGGGGASGTVRFQNSASGALGAGYLAHSATADSAGTLVVDSNADLTMGTLYGGTQGQAGQYAQITVTGAGSTLTQTGASVVTLGAAANGTAQLLVSSTGEFTTGTGLMTINATGTVLVHTGGTLHANGGITINGGRIELFAGALDWAASKTMTIQSGGRLTHTTSWLLPANATVNVTGAGSLVDVTNALGVSDGADVNVSDGAAVTASRLDVGVWASAAASTIVVDGSGSSLTLASGSHYVGGNTATGSLTFQNSASGSLPGTLYVGTYLGGSGTLAVQTDADLTLGNLAIGTGGTAGQTGTVTLANSGSTITQTGASYLTLGATAGSTAAVQVSGGTFDTGTGTTMINPTGTITVSGGTVFNHGNITISGGRMEFAAGAWGWDPAKTMTVRNGGRFAFPASFGLPTDAIVNIQDVGSSFEAVGLSVGVGAGVNVTDGGGLLLDSYLHVGDGTVVVEGTGSRVDLADTATVSVWGSGGYDATVTFRSQAAGQFLGTVQLVGDTAAGTSGVLNVESGADVTVEHLRVNTAGGSTAGAVTVTGTGSTVTHLPGFCLYLGHASDGIANLNVYDGAAYAVDPTGHTYLYATGRINLDGGTVSLGPLTLYGGGRVNFYRGALDYTGSLRVGVDGLFGDGDLDLSSAHRLTLTGTTTVDPFYRLTLSGGQLTTSSLVVNGTFDFQRGTLALTGPTGLIIGTTGPFGSSLTLNDGCRVNLTSALTVNSAAQLVIDGGQVTAASAGNFGTILLAGGGLSCSTTLANQSSGRLFVDTLGNLETPGAITNAGRLELLGGAARVGGAGTLTNTGLILGSGEIAKATTNQTNAEIRVEAGNHLVFSGTNGTNSGYINVLGGTVEFLQALANGSTGKITGRGTYVFGGGLENFGAMQFSGGPTDVYGSVSLAGTGKVINSGGYNVATFYNAVDHRGSEIRTSATNTTVFFGAVTGPGSFTGAGTVQFEGAYSPGASPALITFGGNVTFSNTARLEMELGGTTPGTQYDRMEIAGQASLGGTLDVVLINPFRPSHGNVFEIITFGSRTGTFTTTSGLDLGSRLTLVPTYTGTNLTLTAAQGGSGTWGVDASGNASVPTNWTGAIPNGPTDTATFGTVITDARKVTVDQPLTLAGMRFDDNNRYTVGGPNALTLQTTGADAAIQVVQSSADGHSISAPLVLAKPLDIDTGTGTKLDLAGVLNNASGRTLTKTGPGTLAISGPQTHGPGATLAVAAGTVDLNSDAGTSSIFNLTVSVDGAVHANFGATQHLAALNLVTGESQVRLGMAKVLVISHCLSIDPAAAQLDLTDNSMIVHYTGGTPHLPSAELENIKAWIAAGYDWMSWAGNGIVSSAAAPTPITYGLGYAQNDMLFLPYDVFSGEPVDSSTILVKFTYNGDVNLDGCVDDNDVTFFNLFYDGGITTSHYWNEGDIFGYDGRVDDNDVTILGLTYGLGIGDPLSGAVPEPATLALLLLGAAAGMRRRAKL